MTLLYAFLIAVGVVVGIGLFVWSMSSLSIFMDNRFGHWAGYIPPVLFLLAGMTVISYGAMGGFVQ